VTEAWLQEAEDDLDEIAAFYQVARRLNETLDVQNTLDSIVLSLKQGMGYRGCSVELLEADSDTLRVHAATGIEERWAQTFASRLGEGVRGRAALEGKPVYVPDVQGLEGAAPLDPGVRSILSVPLIVGQRVIGTLSADSDQPHAFTAADERLLTAAAGQAAAAIESARLFAVLQQRAEILATAYAELREAERLKDEMLHNVSHELRTPLTFVKGYVELLLAEAAGPLTGEQRDYLTIVADKTNAITRLVGDITSVQSLEYVPGKVLPVSLREVIRRAFRTSAARAETIGVSLAADIPVDIPPVAADKGRLLQVFDHLIDNAVKFSPGGGRVLVSAEDIGPMVQVAVSDEGIGILEEEQERIFEAFYQVDSSAQRQFGGAGVGLAIVRHIVEAHGGKVWVESEPGKGSTFYFTLPKHTSHDR